MSYEVYYVSSHPDLDSKDLTDYTVKYLKTLLALMLFEIFPDT